MLKTVNNKSLSYLQLLIFPAAFLCMQILLKIDYKWFYLSGFDPSYAFLFNGLNLAQGNTQLGLSGFPGTTLQCLVALNLFICNLFSANTSLAETVLSNPEHYLQIISYELVAINTTAILFLGLYTYKRLRNLPLSLALQLSPFVSVKAFSTNSVIMLEPVMNCIVLLMIAVITVYAFGKRESMSTRDLVITGILAALGIATKIVFFPLVILPAFAIEGFRRKLLYATVVALSLAIFLIPIYPTFSSFLTWNFNLFTHTGAYGSGNYDLFDPETYARNLISVFKANYFFTGAFLLVVISSLIIHLPAIKKTIGHQKLRIVSGLSVVFILSVLMVAKHYSAHYLFTYFTLSVFGYMLFLSIIPVQRFLNRSLLSNQWFKTALVYAGSGLLIFFTVKRIDYSPSFRSQRLKGVDFVKSFVKSTQRIIVLERSGPFKETALFHGLAYSNGMKAKYSGILQTAYPSTYFYSVHRQSLQNWIHDCNLNEILSRSTRTYIYHRSKKDTIPVVLLRKLEELQHKNFIRKIKTAYADDKYSEYIYEIEVDSQKIASTITRQDPIICDFNSITDDKNYFSSTDSAFVFNGTDLQSGHISFSGQSSVKLDPAHPYGPGIKIIPHNGYYEISVMRYSDGSNGFVVASDKTGSKLYKSNAISTGEEKGWDKIKLTIDIPKEMEGEEISVFLWYPGKNSCYFDDLAITYCQVD